MVGIVSMSFSTEASVKEVLTRRLEWASVGCEQSYRDSKLRYSASTSREPLIDDAPECRNRLPFFVEEVFKETRLVKRRRIRISLSIVTELSDPIHGFLRVDYRKQTARI